MIPSMDLLSSQPIYFEFKDRKFPMEAKAGANIWISLRGLDLKKFLWSEALPTLLFAFSSRFKKNKTTQLPEPLPVDGLPSIEEIEDWIIEDAKPWQHQRLIKAAEKILERDYTDPDAKPDPNVDPATTQIQ